MLGLLNSAAIWVLLILCAITMLGSRSDTRPWQIGWAYVVFIAIWLSLYLADTAQEHVYTTGTVIARWLVVAAVFLVGRYVKLMTNKLKQTNLEIEQLKQQINSTAP